MSDSSATLAAQLESVKEATPPSSWLNNFSEERLDLALASAQEVHQNRAICKGTHRLSPSSEFDRAGLGILFHRLGVQVDETHRINTLDNLLDVVAKKSLPEFQITPNGEHYQQKLQSTNQPLVITLDGRPDSVQLRTSIPGVCILLGGPGIDKEFLAHHEHAWLDISFIVDLK